MESINCLLIEEQGGDLSQILEYMRKNEKFQLARIINRVKDVMEFINKKPVDLLIVNLDQFREAELMILEKLIVEVQVIAISSDKEKAVLGYELGVSDFLFRPFTSHRLSLALSRTLETIELKRKLNSHARSKLLETNHILVKSAYKTVRIRLKDIFYIQSMREYVAFYTKSGRILSLGSLRRLETELPDQEFLRIHKSYIISVDKIEMIHKNQVRINDQMLPIGGTYKTQVVSEII